MAKHYLAVEFSGTAPEGADLETLMQGLINRHAQVAQLPWYCERVRVLEESEEDWLPDGDE